MAVTCDPKILANDARCFARCIPQGGHAAIQTYLLALVANNLAGTSTDPNTLANLASGFRKVDGFQVAIQDYLLCQLVSGCSDPSTLANNARCFSSCIPYGELGAVETYLLAQLSNSLTGSTTDPSTLMNLARCFECYSGFWAQIQTYLICQIVNNAGSGGGGGGGGVVTDTPTLSSLVLSTDGASMTATWTAPVDTSITGTEVWVSADNVTFLKISTVAGPLLTYTGAGPTAGQVSYVKVRFTNGSNVGPFSGVLNVPDTVVANWAARVVTNGGAAVALGVVSSTNVFYTGLKSSGFLAKMIALNTVAPGSHISMRTPLIVGGGNDPWSTTSIQAGAVTANGWFDNPGAVNQSLNTGLKPSTMGWTAASGGFTFYASLNNAANTLLSCGATAAGGADPLCAMYHCYSGAAPHSQTSYLYSSANQTSRQLGDITGFISTNRTANNAHSDYWANSGNAFQVLSSEVVVAGAPTQANNFFFGGHNDGGAGVSSNRTYGLMALHMGLTSAECQAFYNLVQALMVAYGWGV